MRKLFIISVLCLITFSSFSQEKFIGKWFSVGYLEASKIKMFDVDSAYIDTTIYAYKTSPIFMEIEQNELELTSFLPLKSKKAVETEFLIKWKNDTAQIFENNVQNAIVILKNDLLEMQVFSTDGLLSRTHFYTNNTNNISSKTSLGKIEKQLISNKWALSDINSKEVSSQVEVIFTKENEMSIANPYGASVSDYKLVEFENAFYIIFENDYTANYMKIVDVSDNSIIIEMPVNKVFEQFKLMKK